MSAVDVLLRLELEQPSSEVCAICSDTLLKWLVTLAQRCVSIGTIANLLSSILTILLTCPNNDT